MSKFWSKAVKRAKPYVPGEQLNDPGIIKLNTNENPYPPSPKVKEAINLEIERLHLYPDPTADALNNTVSAYYGVSKEQVFVGNGSDEVLAFSFMAFFDQWKKIRYPAITYSFYPVYANLFYIPVEEVPLNRNFSLPVEAFFQSEGGVIFPNPNAPTSRYLNLDAIKEIVENNPDNVVIIDEAYVDFAEKSAVELTIQYDNLLVIQTLSKSRSLAGLRVGFAIGHPKLIEGLNRVKDSFNSYTIDRLAMKGARASILDREYFKETTAKIIHTREWVKEEMKKRGFHVLPSQTNFLFACHYQKSASQLYKDLKEDGVLIRHFNKPKIDNYIRVTIGTDEQMENFLRKLDKVI
ncbi:histidinol-phosphate transaminase [Virgibacillus oceani]